MKKIFALSLLTVLIFVFAIAANAAVGTVVYGYKTNEVPNLEIIDETWGEPSIYVDKNSPNTELHKYWTEEIDTSYYAHGGTGPNGRQNINPEESDFWMYILYDDTNLYVAVKSPDVLPSGCDSLHRGDGVHLYIQPLSEMANPYNDYGMADGLTEYDDEFQALEEYYHFYWNLNKTCDGVDKIYAGLRADVANITFADGYMHAILSVPLSNFGLEEGEDLTNFEFGTSMMRCSSFNLYDEGYAGWLSWGATLSEYTKIPESVNTIILLDEEKIPVKTDEADQKPENEVNSGDTPKAEKDNTTLVIAIVAIAVAVIEAAVIVIIVKTKK